MLLAIDTSTRYAGVLLWEEGIPIVSTSWYSTRNHTAELMPAIQHILLQAGIKPKALHGITLALGPGGFSALRVGMSAAKGFSLALKLPLVGISTLEAEAYPYAYMGGPVCPLLNISRHEVAWACYERRDGNWQNIRSEKIMAIDQVAQAMMPGAILCGEGLLNNGPQLRKALGQKVTVVEYPGPSLRLWALARLGAEQLECGHTDDPATLQPLYLRSPKITQPNPPRKVKP